MLESLRGFLQLNDFVIVLGKIDNVFRASRDVLKATGLMATIVWVGCGDSIQVHTDPGLLRITATLPVRGCAPIPQFDCWLHARRSLQAADFQQSTSYAGSLSNKAADRKEQCNASEQLEENAWHQPGRRFCSQKPAPVIYSPS